MYLEFYGLKERPFNLSPDPRFLYLTPAHREALSQLVYGIQERKGFIVLTGEVGTGKTTLLHSLIGQLDGMAEVALVVHSALPFDELLEYALEDFGVKVHTTSPAQRLFAFNEFLIERHRAGQNCVLILDEAQNLSVETLEQVRLLSNFEMPSAKLLQILLVGQPELKAHLELDQLRQLRQRIGLRCSIHPLQPDEAQEYIQSRLRIAGVDDPSIFTQEAMTRVTAYAGGIPRVINMVCDHALLFGYADQKRPIDIQMIEQAIGYLEEGLRRLPQRPITPQVDEMPMASSGVRPKLWLGVVGMVAVLIGILAAAIYPEATADLVQRIRKLVRP